MRKTLLSASLAAFVLMGGFSISEAASQSNSTIVTTKIITNADGSSVQTNPDGSKIVTNH